MRRAAYLAILVGLLLSSLGLVAYKLYVLRYPLESLLPVASYRVELVMRLDGHGEEISLATFLPATDHRQTVSEEQSSTGVFALTLQNEEGNRLAGWRAEEVRGSHQVTYGFTVLPSRVEWQIPKGLSIPASYPPGLEKELAPSEGIQSDDPLIAAEAARLFPTAPPADIGAILAAIHRHLQDDLPNRDFSGFTDAITALKLGEASCNGKSRLFAALLRHLGIPARLAGGLILQPGRKRVTHQWVEAWVNGHWVPFDTINDHFASLPENYLRLYTGDMVLFTHTPNINFQYEFAIERRLVARGAALADLERTPLNALDLYDTFRRVGITPSLLRIILMLPLGALVVVIFRNVVGVQTFGTFLPALIAAAARESGLWWGLLGFTAIILLASALRKSLDWMQLLHSPKMGVMLTVVVILLLSLGVLGVRLDLLQLAHLTLFPIAILAITAERFALIETEQGIGKALRVFLATQLVTAASYAVMSSLFLQTLVLAFPELLLTVIALHLWLGKWVGIRLAEFFRFRRLIFGGAR